MQIDSMILRRKNSNEYLAKAVASGLTERTHVFAVAFARHTEDCECVTQQGGG